MNINPISPTGKSYSQALEINNFKRLVFVSGQIPETREEVVPEAFEDQCRLAWKNVEIQLNAAAMGFNNLVKVTVFLSDRVYREENSRIRKELLKEISPALTIIITGIYDEKWLLEIEAVAAEL
jgi:2-iminobutanoate/2-iminopropanoate deaminase